MKKKIGQVTSRECVKIISSNEISFLITDQDNQYICKISSYKYGIFRIVMDSLDETIKYKTKTTIGQNLEPLPFECIEILADKTILQISDADIDIKSLGYSPFKDNNTRHCFRLVIYYDFFQIDYYIDNILLSTFNRNKTLKLETEVNANCTSNAFDIVSYNFSHVFGLPERLSHVILPDDSYRLFNLDCFDQEVGNPQALYGAIPMLHSINKDYLFTVFLNNASDTWVDIKTENTDKVSTWISEGGAIDLYLHSDGNFQRNFYKMAKITGFAIMPPLFALGYHQCRWGYTNKDITDVDDKMDAYQIPYDVMWLDIDHTNAKKYFTWDPLDFENISSFISTLKSKGRILVTIIDPHLKCDESYDVPNTLKEKGCLVMRSDPENVSTLVPFSGACWPGTSYYADFLNYEKILPLYKLFFKNEKYFLNFGNIHTWIDMNEPSVFDGTTEVTMPKDNIHYDGEQYVQHKDIHNIYGHCYHHVAYESLKHRYDSRVRPFVLSRSFFAGSQQYGFIWTGDNRASFDFMENSIETILTIGLCGISACGADVGGFWMDPTPGLMRAWFELGVFYPFFRGHSHHKTIRREPWLFDNKTLVSMASSIKLRYNLLLYFYTKFYEHTLTGIPILSPIWIKFRSNFMEYVKWENSMFVVGDEFVIMPYFKKKKANLKFLEDNSSILYDFDKGILVSSLEKANELDVEKRLSKFVIAGSIIPWIDEPQISSEYTIQQPISLKIFPDINGNATGRLYYDNGKDLNTNGSYVYLSINLSKFSVLKIENMNTILTEIQFKDTDNASYSVPSWKMIEIFGVELDIEAIETQQCPSVPFEKKANSGLYVNLSQLNIPISKNLELTIVSK